MTETNLMNFNFNNTAIRTLLINNEPWFVAKDIADILGYMETANMRKLIDEVDYQEIDPQHSINTGFVQNGTVLESNPNIRRMLIINESGLYTAIFNSTKPGAKQFKKWVTSEVLPSIRKHGMYATPDTLNSLLGDPDFAISVFTKLKEEQSKVKQLQIANDEQQEFIEVIRDSKKTRVYKKDLRSECVKIVQRMNKLYAMPFQDIWDEAYTKLMKLHFVEWKREFYQANNKLDYLAQKHISYLKDLKDILIAMSKPDKAEVTA